MNNRKLQFQQDWLASNWDKFVDEGVEDSHGRLITVADALAELTRDEWLSLNAAFAAGAPFLAHTVESIAKAYLLETVVTELWANHMAELEDKQRQYKDELAEIAFENYDMNRSR